MNVLVLGSGGREHAIVRKLKESPKAEKIYCAPGNAGIAKDAGCFPVSVTDKEGVLALAKELCIDLVFIAPEDPLAMGMADYLEKNGVAAFGPTASAAIIESSKVFSKNLMKKYGIPTAAYEVFSDPNRALSYIRERAKFPVVIKADGLALGKGAIIASDDDEAEAALKTIMVDKTFGSSGDRVVVEEFLTGTEITVLAFTDGETVCPMVSSMDHKRAEDDDRGLNTGGMGSVSPNPYYSENISNECMEKIFLPTIQALKAEGRPFKGCLYFGLMLTDDGCKVIEYNCRFGDPETQVVLKRLDTDLIDIINAVRDGNLDKISIKWKDDAAACVVLASPGYPGRYPKGLPISGLDSNGQVSGATVYHAGTVWKDGGFYTNGGRVLGVTALGRTLGEAVRNAYAAAGKISFPGMMYRKDIGKKALMAMGGK